MKFLKLLGLAATLAVAFSAYLGSGSASADVLCNTEVKVAPCGNAWHVPIGTQMESSVIGSAQIFTTSKVEIATCPEGTEKWELGNTGGLGIDIQRNNVVPKFENCTHKFAELKSGTDEVEYIEGTVNGTMLDSGSEFTLETAGVSCDYGTGTGTDIGTLDGGSEAKEMINAVLSKTSGSFLCPSSIIYAANFTITKPKPVISLAS